MAVGDSFRGFFAEFYDILHAGLRDVEAYTGYAREFGPRVLELGSGTGRILIPLACAGFEVTGVDISDDMIAVCRQKLEFESSEVRARTKLIKADIIDLDLSDTFDLVIAPCNLINCLVGSGEGMALLRCARRHLKDGGTFILDSSIPDIPYMVKSNGQTRIFEFTHPLTGTTIVDTFTAHYDFALQIETDHIILEERDDGGRLLRREEATEVQTWYFPREIRLMLESAGLRIFHEQGSITEDIPIDSDAREMVFFCRKG